MERLYLDTNVLFPMALMDLLLAMAEDFHHDFLWSDFLLNEWERVIVRERHRTAEQASAITAAIRQAFLPGDRTSLPSALPPAWTADTCWSAPAASSLGLLSVLDQWSSPPALQPR